MNQTFPKYERLNHQKLIEQLWKEGRTFKVHPVRVLYLPVDLPVSDPVQLLVAVPKKRVRHAAVRNQIKRQLREAYRCHRQPLHELLRNEKQQLALAFIYQAPEPLVYTALRDKIILSLQRLESEFEADRSNA